MAELLYINSSGTNVYGGYYTGQSFTTTGAWLVQSIWIDSVRTLTAGPFDVTCSIYLDAGGVPTGAALGVSDPVSCNNVLAAKTFTFSTPFSLNNATKYWAIIDCAGADATWFVRTDSSAYANGEVGYGSSGDLSDFAGDSSYDCKQFKVNGLEAPSSYASVKDGEWDDGDTWGYPASAGGFYPSVDGDTATITHTVTYSISADVELGDITINSGGTLSFNPSANTLLTLGHDWLYVNDGATLNVGTSATPIHKNYTAEIAVNCTADLGSGIDMASSSDVNIYGDPDYYGADEETFMANTGTGSLTITATDDMSSKWRIGQEIVIHKNDTWAGYNVDYILTTIVGISGTIIECADSVSSDFKSGGIICNLSRNVMFYKLGYDGSVGSLNSNRPDFTWWNVSANSANLYDCSIAGFYRIFGPVQAQNASKLVRNVFRNGYIFTNQPYYAEFTGGIVFQAAAAVYGTTLNNRIDGLKVLGISGSNAYQHFNSHWLNCYISGCQHTFYVCQNVKVENCYCQGNQYTSRNAWKFIWKDSNICGCLYTFYNDSHDVKLINCEIGWDSFGNSRPNTFDLAYGSTDYTYINCKAPQAGWTHRDVNTVHYMGRHAMEHEDQVYGTHKVYDAKGTIEKVDADGGGSRPNQRLNGNSTLSEIVTLSQCDSDSANTPKMRRLEVLRHQIYTQAGVEKIIKYYVQTDYTGGLSSDEIWLDVYYDTTNIQSTDTVAIRSNQSDWSQYVEVTVTPSQDSWIRLKINIAAYESGKYIWIDPKPEIIF